LLRRIIVVGRVPQIQAIAQELAREVFVADDLREAADIITAVSPDVTIFDGTWAPAQIQAHLQQIAANSTPTGRTIVVTSTGGPFGEKEYRQAGVSDYFTEPADLARLRDFAAALGAAARRPVAAGTEARTYFVDETAAAVALAGCSPAIHRALQMIKLVAASNCNPVLVTGDTGTGKEVAARAVHHLRHPGRPFVAVNCAALTANLLESELFGHVKGSFTGADRDKTGLLEMAGTGTIFLDEISEMPLDLQAKLLRILQEKTFRKVGGVRDLDCRATIIASSNRDLKKEIREKRFRQDLYYRLNICPIQLTPLRSPQRRQDIQLLATYFLQTSSICAHRERRVSSITQLALEALCRHDWPGNVRELRNVIERAILLETTDKIGLSSIIIDPLDSDEPLYPGRTRSGEDFSLEKAERELIARALHETGWQKTQAAALLGITRATLYAKVKQYDIRQERHAVEEAGATAEQPSEAVATAAY
jgi:DNA-binding NtrC family response regulator